MDEGASGIECVSMLGWMIVLRIFILCCREVGDRSRALLCFLIFVIIVLFWIFFLKDGTRHIPRYVYGLFCDRIESC